MTQHTDDRSVEVAVAILTAADGRVLLCRRPPEARYGGKWEFPGGKLERGESPLDALRRELREELDIEVAEARLLHQVETRYDDGGVFAVRFFVVEQWLGEPRNLAASELRWVAPEDLGDFDVLEGSRQICGIIASQAIDSTTRAD